MNKKVKSCFFALILMAAIICIASVSINASVLIGGTEYYYLGDVTINDDVAIDDVTLLQKSLAQLEKLNELQQVLANVDGDSEVTISDATTIQKYLARIEDLKSKVGETVEYTGEVPTTTQPVTETMPQIEGRSPVIPYAEEDALYVHGVSHNAEADKATEEGWSKSETYDGVNYFFIPVSTNASYVEIFNSYNEQIDINGTKIAAKTSAYVSYTEGIALNVKVGSSQTVRKFYVKRSLAEGALYFNLQNSKGEYDYSELEKIDSDKEIEGKGTAFLANNKGYVQTNTVSKFKGRGNSTWNLPKKPYNITFGEAINMDGLEGRKFSLLANYQDASALRNRMLYDMANELEMPYSPDSRYVDFYINGVYRGSYQMADKVELGTNDLVSLKNNMSATVTTNFNFLLELGEAKEDYVSTSRGNNGVLKDPVPETSSEIGKTQMAFIKSKFQALEDALFSGSLSTLEQVIDIDSLAKMYLVNEFCKNVDGGNYSLFFTYDAEKDLFFAAPVWDFDVSAGNLYDAAAGGMKIELPDGLFIKNKSTRNRGACYLALFAQMNGAEYLVKNIYEEYMPEIMDILAGKAQSQQGRLKSIAEYKTLLSKSMEMNYMKWTFPSYANNFHWIPDQNNLKFINANLTTTSKTYKSDFNGAVDFLYDWSLSRNNWLTDYYDGVTEFGPKVTYYITGTRDMTGANFSANDSENKMTETAAAGVHVKTYTLDPLVPTGGAVKVYPYRFRVTDGTFDKTWGYTHLGEVSLPQGITLGTSGTSNNINFIYDGTVECEKINLTITFNVATQKVNVSASYVK